MLRFRRIHRCVLLGAFCAVLLSTIPSGRAAFAAPAPTTTLGALLNPDGTLSARGFSGSLDANGWALAASPTGQPRFVRVAAQNAADDRWDDRWGVPGVQGGWGDIVSSVAIDARGHVYVAGSFTHAGTLDVNSIARWDGRRWHALGAGLDGPVKQMLFLGTTLYVVGSFATAGNVEANQVARWNGSAWSAVGTGVGVGAWDGEIRTLAAVGTSLYVGGEFEAIDGVPARNIARWDGTRWQPLARGVGDFNFDQTDIEEWTGVVSTLLASQGKLYVGGEFDAVGNPNRVLRANSIALWDGARWSTLGSGMIRDAWGDAGDIRALALSGTTLYAGGAFVKVNGLAANNIAAWNGTTWSALGNGVRDTADGQTPVRVMLVSGASVYVGGYFNLAGNKAANALATWNTSTQTWTPQQPALEPHAEVVALARANDGSVFVGGSFDQAGDTWVNNITRMDTTGWRVLGEGLGDVSYSHTGTLHAVAVDRGGRIYVGGEFARAGGIPVKNLAMWDTTRWQAIGAVEGRVRALVVNGDDLYVGGEFTRAGGTSANHVARWNRLAKQWSALGSGVNGEVRTLAYDAGRLYVGGDFTAAGGVAAFDVAYWEESRWRPFGSTFRIYERTAEGAEYNSTVQALAVAGKDVIIGGQFQTIHRIGTPTGPIENYRLVNNVVRWNRATDAWSTLGTLNATQEPGVTENGLTGQGVHVNALAIANNSVYVGGAFNQAGTVATNGIVRWKAADNTWAALGAGVGGTTSPKCTHSPSWATTCWLADTLRPPEPLLPTSPHVIGFSMAPGHHSAAASWQAARSGPRCTASRRRTPPPILSATLNVLAGNIRLVLPNGTLTQEPARFPRRAENSPAAKESARSSHQARSRPFRP